MAKTLRVEIVGDSSSLQRALNRSSAAASTFGGRMKASGESISAVGASMTKKLTLPIVAAGAAAVHFGSQFEASMELIHTQSGAAQSEVESLHQKVLDLAPKVGTGPDELAKGLFHLESQGLRGAKAMAALKIAAEGAKVGQADLEDVTNALGAAVTVGIKGTENYSKAMGALNATVGEGDMRMQDLADAFGTNLVGQAKIAGVSITDLGGALAVFGDANIRGAEAGTMLSQAIRVMGAGSKATDKQLKTIGLSNRALALQMSGPGGLVGAFTLLKKKMDDAGLDATAQAQFLSRAFGGKQAGGIKLLLAQLDRLKMKTDAVGEGANSFANAWDDTTKTTAFKFQAMQAIIEAALVGIGGHLLGPITAISNAIKGAFQWFDGLSPRMQRIILIAAGVAAAIGPVVGLIGTLVTAIGGLSTALMFLAANPVVLVIAAIAALAAGIAAAILWPDKFAAALERMGVSGEHVRQIQAIIQQVMAAVQQVVSTTAAVVQAIWDRFGSTILAYTRASWENLKTLIQGALMTIKGIIEVITGLIHGDWGRVWDGLKLIFQGWVMQIEALARQVMATLQAQFRASLTIIENVFRGAWNAIKAAASSALNGLVSAVEGAVGKATSAATAVGKGIVDGVKHGLASIVAVVKGGLDKIWGVISTVASLAFTAATAIGSQIMHGIAAGIEHALGAALGAIRHAGSAILGAAKGFLHINSPSLLFSQEVGSPIMEGIIHGILSQEEPAKGAVKKAIQATLATAKAADIMALVNQYGKELGLAQARSIVMGLFEGTPGIVAQARTALQQATAAARQAALDAKSSFRSAFEQLANEAFAAFDAKAAAWVPPAQLILNKMQLEDQINAAAQAIADAQTQVDQATAQLNEDTAKGPQEGESPEDFQKRIQADQDAITAAQRQLGAAQRAQDELNEQLLAAQQQAAHDKKMAKDRENLAAQLAQLEKFLLKHPQAWNTMQGKVEAILKSHEVPMFTLGQKIATQFGDGIAKGIKEVIKQLQNLADHLPHSPAKKGPLSADLFKGGRDYATMLVDGFASVKMAPALASLGFGAPRAGLVAGRSSGGDVHVHFNAPVYGDEASIGNMVRKHLRDYDRNNARSALATS